MKFEELIEDLTWDEVKEALEKNYNIVEEDLIGYEKVFFKLRGMDSVENKMKIYLNYIEKDVLSDDIDFEPYWDLYGRNGTLNKDTSDAEMFEDAQQDWLDAEVTYGLDFTPWNEWLGMEIDEETANNIMLTRADIVSHCLWELTFISYDEEDIQGRLEELTEQVEKIKNMTPEELKNSTVTMEELMEDIKNIDNEEGEDDNLPL